jgi:hypothetical protein
MLSQGIAEPHITDNKLAIIQLACYYHGTFTFQIIVLIEHLLMVCMSTVYRFTMFMYFKLIFVGEEKEIKVKVAMKETLGQRIDSRKFFICSIFRDITFLKSLRFLQYHGYRFYATYHSSSSHQNILSTSYSRNTKIQSEQRFYRGFTRIDSSKLIYRLTINTT